MISQSRFTKECCRPFNPRNKDLEIPPDLLRIFERSSHTFKGMARKKLICTPRSLLYKAERAELEETLSNMEGVEKNREQDGCTKE